MGIEERKSRDRAEREQRIVATARLIAEREGWAAVTVRRLADEIEYSQPVLYGHFENRDAIVAAVALEGFRDLAAVLEKAGRGPEDPRQALERVALAYLAFARTNPALYEAMFTLPTGLRFARSDTPAELRAGFGAMAAVMPPHHLDIELATETFWATLHGLAALEQSGRIRESARNARVALVIDGFLAP